MLCSIYYSWVDPLFCIAYKRSLNHADLYVHPSEGDSEYLLNTFNRFVTCITPEHHNYQKLNPILVSVYEQYFNKR